MRPVGSKIPECINAVRMCHSLDGKSAVRLYLSLQWAQTCLRSQQLLGSSIHSSHFTKAEGSLPNTWQRPTRCTLLSINLFQFTPIGLPHVCMYVIYIYYVAWFRECKVHYRVPSASHLSMSCTQLIRSTTDLQIYVQKSKDLQTETAVMPCTTEYLKQCFRTAFPCLQHD
jgi:hypothetical protein